MTKVDLFESVFRAASKEIHHYEPVKIETVLLVTDLPPEEAADFEAKTRSFLAVLESENPSWIRIGGKDYTNIKELLERVEEHRPDLICTYRHLKSEGWRWAFSLGEYLDVLTQATSTPVLVLPHPGAGREAEHSVRDTNVVLAVTDHLTGDEQLVNYGVRFTEPGGTLYLSHVEDDKVFQRYMDVISKVPGIDTETAREQITKQLLKEPRDYIASCRRAVTEAGGNIQVEASVLFGHLLTEYERLIHEHHIDLLVMHTKDEDQLAMHGLAYPLAVQLRQIPLLML